MEELGIVTKKTQNEFVKTLKKVKIACTQRNRLIIDYSVATKIIFVINNIN